MPPFATRRFEALAAWTSAHLGHPAAFLVACLTVVAWAAAGPAFAFSDTWQLVINTGTTIITFLMVFLLQNTGNRATRQLQERLDALELLNRELLHEIRRERAARPRPPRAA